MPGATRGEKEWATIQAIYRAGKRTEKKKKERKLDHPAERTEERRKKLWTIKKDAGAQLPADACVLLTREGQGGSVLVECENMPYEPVS